MKKLFAIALAALAAAALALTVSAADVFKTDTSTGGDWVGRYGADAYLIAGETADTPVEKNADGIEITVTSLLGGDAGQWVWWDEAATPDCPDRGVVEACLWADESRTSRRAACFFDSTGIDVTVNVGDAKKLVTLYLHDFDGNVNTPRAYEVVLYDEDLNEIDYIDASELIGGVYVTVEVTGTMIIECAPSEGPNVAISGVFVDPVDGSAAALGTSAGEGGIKGAAFEEAPIAAAKGTVLAGEVAIDSATGGDWIGHYGSDAYYIVGETQDTPLAKLPDGIGISVDTMAGDPAPEWVWWDEATTPECPRGSVPEACPWTSENKTSRRAGCIYDGEGLNVRVNIGDARKLVTLYLLDFDNNGRSNKVAFLDDDMNEIHAAEVSDFVGGVYVTAEMSGSFTVQCTPTGSSNVALTGIFVDPVGDVQEEPAAGEGEPAADEPAAEIPSVSAVTAGDIAFDAESGGNWVGRYGADAYYIVGASADAPCAKIPDGMSISAATASGNAAAQWAWWNEAETPACPENCIPEAALWTDEGKTARCAACFYDGSGLEFTVNVGDAKKLVTLYLLDFDNGSRAYEVTFCDQDMNRLHAADVVDFAGGLYVTAEASGTVTVKCTLLGGPNVAVSGIFVDPTDTSAGTSEAAAPAEETEKGPESQPDEGPEEKPKAPNTGDFPVFGSIFLLMSAAAALIFKRKEV